MNIIEILRNKQEYFEDFVTRSTYHSNAIEGSTISYADTYAIIFNDNSFKVSAKPREIYDAINHKYALSKVMEYAEKDCQLDKDLIIYLGKILNRNINEINGYRKISVRIRGAEYIPPAAYEVPQAMIYFIDNMNNFGGDNIFEKTAMMHIQFERIHPFEDGNGKTGRLLVNFELLKNNVPPIVIPHEERSRYFEALSNYDIASLSSWFEELSNSERQRIKEITNEILIDEPNKRKVDLTDNKKSKIR